MKYRIITAEEELKRLINETFITERPNQAIKFLKQKQMDPDSNPKGKEILDKIIQITNADGFTGLLTVFHVNDRLPMEEIEDLYLYFKNNRDLIKQLPKQIFQYDRYADLRTDLDNLEKRKAARQLINQMPSFLKQQAKALDGQDLNRFYKLGSEFAKLDDKYKQEFISKISGFKQIGDLMDKLEGMIIAIESGETPESIQQKIEQTDGAELMHYDPEKNIMIAYIHKFEASKKLGCTSNWCITRDPQYWRTYKKGGNRYFFIWDFNHTPEEKEYLIGTAYDAKDPESSQTHLKDNERAYLGPELKQKGLDFELFNGFLQTIKDKFLASIDGQAGFMDALVKFENKTDQEALVNHIANSELVSENGKPDDVSIYRGGIETTIDKENWKSIFEIEDNYDYVSGYINSYYGSGNNYDMDPSEFNYMQNYLSEENMNLLKKVGKKFGFSDKQLESWNDDDGALYQFLEKNDLSIIYDEFEEGYEEAMSDAYEREAKEQIATLPVDIDDGVAEPEKMLKIIQDNELQVDSFDEFIEEAKAYIDIDYETIDDAVYSSVDYDEMNIKVKDKIEDVLRDLDDPDSELYEKINTNRVGNETLEKLDFEQNINGDWIKHLPDKNAMILVKGFVDPYYHTSVGNFPQSGLDDISAEVEIFKNREKVLAGNILLSNLAKYITQYSIPFKEKGLTSD